MKEYINIKFQEGPINDVRVNGCQIEDVINVLVDRLNGFQKTHPCRENALAITNLEQARMWLEERTRNRTKQGVEDTMKDHVPQPVCNKISVNGREIQIERNFLSYRDIVGLAGASPEVLWSITYSRGKHGPYGMVAQGSIVEIINGMIFNIAHTGNA